MIIIGSEHVGRVLYSRAKMCVSYTYRLVPFRVVAVGEVYASIEWLIEGKPPIPEKLHRFTGQTMASFRKHGNHSSFGRVFYESVEQYNATIKADHDD